MTTKKRPPKEKPQPKAKGTATPRTGQDPSTPVTKEAAGVTAKAPDYDKWMKREFWPLDAAVSLLLGWEPTSYQNRPDRSGPILWTKYRVPTLGVPSDLHTHACDIRDRLRESVENGNKTLVVRRKDKVPEYNDKDGSELPWIDLHEVEPHSFVKWANGKGYAIPPELCPLLEQAAPEEPPGTGAGELRLYRDGRWLGSEEQLDKALAAFSMDNRRPGAGFAITRAEPVRGEARRRWHVYWTPYNTSKLLPNGALDPDGYNAHAIIRALDTPKGLEVDIQHRGWRLEAIRDYLGKLVKYLSYRGLEIFDAMNASPREIDARCRMLGVAVRPGDYFHDFNTVPSPVASQQPTAPRSDGQPVMTSAAEPKEPAKQIVRREGERRWAEPENDKVIKEAMAKKLKPWLKKEHGITRAISTIVGDLKGLSPLHRGRPTKK